MSESMNEDIDARFDEALKAIRLTREHLSGRIADAAALLIESMRAGGAVWVFGNGGSAADAQHIAGELLGRFLRERSGFRAAALSTDTSTLTSVANDYGFEHVFSRQIEGLGRAGDVAMGLSTSGNSTNVVAALTRARQLGLRTIALTGAGGGRCANLADVLLDVPASSAPRVQEAHAVIYHVLCELVERELSEPPPE